MRVNKPWPVALGGADAADRPARKGGELLQGIAVCASANLQTLNLVAQLWGSLSSDPTSSAGEIELT